MEDVSGKRGLTKKETQNVIDITVETIGDTLSRGEKVTLAGFGTFQLRKQEEEQILRQEGLFRYQQRE